MTKRNFIFAFAILVGGQTIRAQIPNDPPPGDMNPSRSGKKTRAVPPTIHPKRPPVVPPTPEKTVPDKTPTIKSE